MTPDSITYDVRYIISGIPFWSRDHSQRFALAEAERLEKDDFCDGYEIYKIEHYETKVKSWKPKHLQKSTLGK